MLFATCCVLGIGFERSCMHMHNMHTPHPQNLPPSTLLTYPSSSSSRPNHTLFNRLALHKSPIHYIFHEKILKTKETDTTIIKIDTLTISLLLQCRLSFCFLTSKHCRKTNKIFIFFTLKSTQMFTNLQKNILIS